MIRLIELPGVRLLETSLATGDMGLVPGRLTHRQFADQIANVNFGTTESGLLPEPLACDASDQDLLEHEAISERLLGRIKSDTLVDDEALIGFFFQRGFDVTNDARRLARCASFFTRIIECGALGCLRPCPNSTVEKWHRIQMGIVEFSRKLHANDDRPDWVARFGAVG